MLIISSELIQLFLSLLEIFLQLLINLLEIILIVI